MAYTSQYQTTIKKILDDVGNAKYDSEYKPNIDQTAQAIADYGDYTGKYDEQISSLADSILNRGDFHYDAESDPSYQAYRDQYTRLGSRAMEDTLGQMATRTGGLASSYAGTAAQDSYNNYMKALSDIIPTLEQNAYSRWRDIGSDMRNNLAMLQGLDDTDYGRWRDALADLYNQNGMYLNLDQNAFSQWQGQLGNQYDYLAALQAQDETEYDRWLTDLQMAMAAASGGSGGGSGRSGSGGSGSSGSSANLASSVDVGETLRDLVANGASGTEVVNILNNALRSGVISQSTYDIMMRKYGKNGVAEGQRVQQVKDASTGGAGAGGRSWLMTK